MTTNPDELTISSNTLPQTKLQFTKLLSWFALIVLIVLTLYFRFVNLGFSDYQGDEGKAMYTTSHATISSYLLDQRKGPLQFITTYVYSLFDPTYSNYFMARLPFALASVFSVLIFYLIAKLFFGKRAAFFATLLFVLNGLFIAFGRIIQYQSYVILFSLLAVYFFALLNFKPKWNPAGLYYGAFFWAMGVLAHYDAIFIFPIVLYLVFFWFKDSANKKQAVKHLVYASLLPFVLCLTFYLPFLTHLSQATTSYWAERISGTEGKISSSIYTFLLYNQLVTLVAYLVFSAFFTLFVVLNLKDKKVISSIAPFLLWFLVPFIFMEVFVKVPGTHFYTYLMPVLMLLGAGIAYVLNIKYLKWPIGLAVTLFFILHIAIQNQVFVDNSRTYPWQEEELGPLKFVNLDTRYYLSVFGFPYSAYWKQTSAYLYSTSLGGTFGTNERSTISKIYLSNYQRNNSTPKFYIHVENHQDLSGEVPSNIKKAIKNVQPVITYRKCTRSDSLNKGYVQFFREQVIGFVDPAGCTGQVVVKIYKPIY